MKSFKSSSLAVVVIVTFLTLLTFGSSLSSCGGGGGGGGDESSVYYGTVQTTSTDADGTASITGSATGTVLNLTITDSAGQSLSGFNVEYVETSDGSEGLMTISDATNAFQTTLVRLDASDLTANVSARTIGGQAVPLIVDDKAFPIALYIVVTILTAYTAYSLVSGIYELAGDPPTLSHYGDKAAACLSADQLLTGVGIVADAVSLLTLGSPQAVVAGAQAAKVSAYQLIGQEIVDQGMGEVEESFFTGVLAELGYEAGTRYCVYTWENLKRGVEIAGGSAAVVMSDLFTGAIDLTPYPCEETATGAWECSSSVTETPSPAKTAFDGDEDGYTPAENDCDDKDKWVNPGMLEICGNGVDDDCDGTDATCTTGLSIEITSPGYDEQGCGGEFRADGICYGTDRALLVGATITADPMPAYAYVLVNGRVFQQTSIADNGDGTGTLQTGNYGILKCDAAGWVNQFGVVINDGTSFGSTEIDYGCTAAATDLLVMLTWDQCANPTELELFVKEPGDEFAYNNSGATANGGEVNFPWGSDSCYGPVYYTITNAPVGDYQIRIHYKSGATTPTYQLTVIPEENFDHEYIAISSMSTAEGAAGTPAGFSGSGASWSTYTWTVSKSALGGWSAPSPD